MKSYECNILRKIVKDINIISSDKTWLASRNKHLRQIAHYRISQLCHEIIDLDIINISDLLTILMYRLRLMIDMDRIDEDQTGKCKNDGPHRLSNKQI